MPDIQITDADLSAIVLKMRSSLGDGLPGQKTKAEAYLTNSAHLKEVEKALRAVKDTEPNTLENLVKVQSKVDNAVTARGSAMEKYVSEDHKPLGVMDKLLGRKPIYPKDAWDREYLAKVDRDGIQGALALQWTGSWGKRLPTMI